MSLINDALRDLELRRETPELAYGAPEEACPAPPAVSHNVRFCVLFSVLLIALAASVVGGLEEQNRPSLTASGGDRRAQLAPVDHALVRANIPAVPGLAEVIHAAPPSHGDSAAATDPQSAATHLASAEPESEAVHDPAAELKRAQTAMSRNRLSVPAGANALFFIRRVLAKDPQNKAALAMLEHVVDLYRAQIDKAIDAGQIARAEGLLERAQIFGLAGAQVNDYQSRVQAVRAPSAADAGAAREYAGDVLAPLAPATTQYRVTESFASYDLRQVALAREMLRQGRTARAESHLTALIDAHPAAVHSLIFLLDHYLERSRAAEARRLLAAVTPDHQALTYLNARLANFYHRHDKAIALLEQSAPSEQMKRAHHGFLAALYHKSKQYRKAQTLYSELLTAHPEDNKYLLGFALCADALGETDRSVEAYRTILRQGHSNPQVLAFAHKRVRKLRAPGRGETQRW